MKRFAVNFLFLFYDLVFIVGFTFYLPFYFLRKKVNLFSLKERLGIFSFYLEKTVWIHAVSVGEVNLIEPVLKRLKETLSCPIVVSTTTLTGNLVAKKKYAKIAKIVYFPLDLSFLVNKFLKRIDPRIFIAVETELWPNFIRCLNRKNIPFVIINGRISNRAFKRYKLIRPLMRKVLSGCQRIGAQNNQYRQRFLHLGANPERVLVTGNLKFNLIAPSSEKIAEYEKKFYPVLKGDDAALFIAASTHHPEEELILDVYSQICQREKVALLLAPRHPKRASGLESLIKARGFNPVPISRIKQTIKGEKNVFILDTIGQLLYFYSLSDICFVGGSFSFSGGHNILEPMYFLKPTLFGPSMENFSDIAKIALDYSAAIQVDSPNQLKEELIALLNDEKRRLSYSEACLDVFKDSKSLDDNVKLIIEELNVS